MQQVGAACKLVWARQSPKCLLPKAEFFNLHLFFFLCFGL